MKTEPESAVSSAAQQCISVDLPDPLGPITAVNSPAARSRLTSSSAVHQRLARCRRSWSGGARARPAGEVVGQRPRWPRVMAQSSRYRRTGAHLGAPPGNRPCVPRWTPRRDTPSSNTCSTPGVMRRAWTSRDRSSRRPPSARRRPSTRLERRALTRGAWVDVHRAWLPDADDVFAALVARRAVAGRAPADVRPRGRRTPAACTPTASASRSRTRCSSAARGALSAHYLPELGEPFVTAGCCYYRDGRDSVAWHGDTIGRGAAQDTMVAIVSLGDPRRLVLRPRRRRRVDLGRDGPRRPAS